MGHLFPSQANKHLEEEEKIFCQDPKNPFSHRIILVGKESQLGGTRCCGVELRLSTNRSCPGLCITGLELCVTLNFPSDLSSKPWSHWNPL